MRADVVLLVSLTALAPPARADAADARPGAATPFASTRPGEIVVAVTVGAEGPFRFLLDTGVDPHRGDRDAGDRGRRRARGANGDARPPPDSRLSGRRLARCGGRCGICRRAHRHGAAAGRGRRARRGSRPRRRRRARAGLPGALRVPDRLPAHADRLARSGLRRAGPAPDAGARAGSLARRAARSRRRRQALRRRCAASCPIRAPTHSCCSAKPAAPAWSPAWRPGTSVLGSLAGDRAVRTATVDGLRVGATTLDGQLAAVVSSNSPDDPDGLLPLHLFASVFFKRAGVAPW